MAIRLEGSCRCGAVRFSLDSHSPQPYQRCYCTICRKTAGGGGYAINIMGKTAGMVITGKDAISVYQADICDDEGKNCKISTGQRNFCSKCATALWMYHPEWPDFIYPFASAIDTRLPTPPERVHLFLHNKADWVMPAVGRRDRRFDKYPEQSIEDWHKQRGLWID
ncbi:MAG: GFA family protein [Xanthobacteraceae bacterium]